VLLLFSVASADAHQSPNDEHWKIHSKILAEDRPIRVHLPPGYSNSQERYPVLYVLDGEALFLPMSGQTEWLQYVYRLPKMIVIGIPNTNRIKDFTSPWTSSKPPGESQWLASRAGGADNFLKFVRTELIPEVEKKHRTAPFRILVGHSLGGLFALHAFSRAPELFQATIAVSPAASWNDDEVMSRLKAGFSGSTWPRGALFLAAATNEGGDTLSACNRLSDLLTGRAPSSLRWEMRILPGEDHGTVALPAVHAGFQFIFSRWRMPGVVGEEGIDAVEQFHAELSKEYGFTVLAPEWEVSRLGYQALRSGEKTKAIDIFRRATRFYPRSPNAYDSLGEALEADGQLAPAREMYEKAVALARESGENVEAFQRRLDALAAKKKEEQPK
jgi:predicted alpha/beta superfamily hydrolase